MAAPALVTHERSARRLLGVLLAGAAASVALGVYGDRHTPTAEQPYSLFFSQTIQLKVWLATAVAVLALVQLTLALRLYGKVRWPREAPPWLGDAHRLAGTLAFLVSLPVAYACLWSLGFRSTDTRVLAHSLLGCLLYGAFVAKVLAVRMRGLPDWLLPVAGGVLFVAFIGVFLTSSLWFFTSRPAGLPLF